jgi:hypothetical protein
MVLLKQREHLDERFTPQFRLDVQDDCFAVTRGKLRKLHGDPGVAIARYQVGNKQVQRIAPLALSPEDFLDEWAQLNWEEARRWTSDSSRGNLQEWHTKLNSVAAGSVEMESIHLCGGFEGGDQTWLLDLAIDQKPNPAIREERIYIEIAKRGGVFSLDAVHQRRPSPGPGTTAPSPIVDWELPVW